MKRRSFIASLGAGGLTIFGGNAVRAAAATTQGTGLGNRYIGIGRGILARPRWKTDDHVVGTMVTLTTGTIRGHKDFQVAVYAQYLFGNQWRDAPIRRGDRYRVYQFQDRVRETERVNDSDTERGRSVALFVPDEALYLREGKTQLRFEVRFFKPDDSPLNHLFRPLPSEDIEVIKGTRKIVRFGFAFAFNAAGSNQDVDDGPPPVEIFDVRKGRSIQLPDR